MATNSAKHRDIEFVKGPLPLERGRSGKYESLSCKLSTRPGQWAEVVDMTGDKKVIDAARRRWAKAGERQGWEVTTRKVADHLLIYVRWPQGRPGSTRLATPYKHHFQWVESIPGSTFGPIHPIRQALMDNEGRWAIVRRESLSPDPNEVARARHRFSKERDKLSHLKGISAAVRVVDEEMRIYARYLSNPE